MKKTLIEKRLVNIREKLELYPIRKIKIEDMKLELKELELGESLKAQSYEEKTQSSGKCKNNDELLYRKERLINTIEYYETINNRVDNWIELIRNEKAKEAIQCLYINKMSKTQTCKRLDRTRKTVENLLKKGEEEIYNSIYSVDEEDQRVSA